MWQTLAEFSKERVESLFSGCDFEPMRRLIFELQKKQYAEDLFSYTSIFSFWITLQSKYGAKKQMDSIGIVYISQIKSFNVCYNNIHLNENSSYSCKNKEVISLIDAFVLRLFLTSENKTLEIEAEEKPTFKLGENVETIICDYNKTFRTGIIYEIAKYHKQNCFMYFIEQDGKKIKKRYFKDHLKRVR